LEYFFINFGFFSFDGKVLSFAAPLGTWLLDDWGIWDFLNFGRLFEVFRGYFFGFD
jgi:hypothetical protein